MKPVETMRCEHDGTVLEGFFAAPEGDGPFPAVMVMHSALGLAHQVGEKVRLLADLGYLAVATDMYGAGADTGSPEAAGQYFMDLVQNTPKLRARAAAWFDAIAARGDVDAGRIGAIGYCFGGKCVLELARSGVDVKAVSSFHGVLTTDLPASPGTVSAQVAAWCGTEDPYAPLTDIDTLRQELTAANARFQITEFSGVAHSFTDPDAAAMGQEGIRYDAIADRVSWGGTMALLDAALRS